MESIPASATATLRAGSARVSLEPPLGLPMLGFVRRHEPARGYGLPLEATALALERGEQRVVLVGVDTLAIQSPEIDRLRERIAAVTGASLAGVLVNFNHTHCAPAGGRSIVNLGGTMADELDAAATAYVDILHEKVVSVCELAFARLEPAGVAWGLGTCDVGVNRREKRPDGRVVLGWNPGGPLDDQVPVLQARRPDGTAIATVVGYGCHTVTVGWDVLAYSADYPGPLRDAVRSWTGGECIFLQGAGGNVLPRVAFCPDEREAERAGRRLALAALTAIERRDAVPRQATRIGDGSVTPISLYRLEPLERPPPTLTAVERSLTFPLQELPSATEIGELRKDAERALDDARASGQAPSELNTLRYHADWARRTEAAIRAGTAPTSVSGPVNAVRIGDGSIVTGPGEVFTEIGLAVRERSPAEVTLYAGYTNGLLSYLPTAASFPEGGYEPGYGNRSFGLPAQVTPECERLLVEAAAELLRSLFPDRPMPDVPGWAATGALPHPPPSATYERPPL